MRHSPDRLGPYAAFLFCAALLFGCANPRSHKAAPNPDKSIAQEERRQAENLAAEQRKKDLEQAEYDAWWTAEKERRAQSENDRLARIDQIATSDAARQAMIQHKVLIGMTRDQVQLSAGKPSQTTRSVSAAGTLETWTYSNVVLVFTDGVVTSFTESR